MTYGRYGTKTPTSNNVGGAGYGRYGNSLKNTITQGNQSPTGYDAATGLVNPSWGKQGADDTYAAITRAMWRDYLNRFAPYEEQLMSQINNTQLLNEQIDRNVGASNQGFDTAKRDSMNAMRSYGTQLSPSQSMAFDRRFDLQKGLSAIDAENYTRQAKADNDMQALVGGQQVTNTLRKQQ